MDPVLPFLTIGRGQSISRLYSVSIVIEMVVWGPRRLIELMWFEWAKGRLDELPA